MGRAQPVEAAAQSGRFGPLTIELYELLLLAPRGATLDAIESKTGLMRLGYIRAEVLPGDAAKRGHAKAVRTAIGRESSGIRGPIRQRDAGIDYGAVVRSLIGVEPGVRDWSLADRRGRAAAKLRGRQTSSLSKTRYKPYQPSYELELMNALAEQLLRKESEFIRNQSPSLETSMISRLGETPWYALLARVWSAAYFIHRSAETLLLGGTNFHGDGTLEISTTLLSNWWDLVSLIAEPGRHGPDMASELLSGERLDGVQPHRLPLVIRECLPESILLSWRAAQSSGSDGDWTQELSDWLNTCNCGRGQPNPDACRVHRLLAAAAWLELTIDTMWRDIPRYLSSPSAYVFSQYSVPNALGLRS